MVTKRDDTLKIIKKTDSCRNFINRSSCNTTINAAGINTEIQFDYQPSAAIEFKLEKGN